MLEKLVINQRKIQSFHILCTMYEYNSAHFIRKMNSSSNMELILPLLSNESITHKTLHPTTGLCYITRQTDLSLPFTLPFVVRFQSAR